MRRRALVVAALGLVMLLSPAAARAFGVHDVIQLHQEQVSDSLIVLKIQQVHQVIHVSSSDFRRLKQAGVSDEVMSALLRTEQVGFQKNAANHAGMNAYGWVVDPYGPYPYPASRFSIAFSYGYGGYLWPAYRPFFYRPYPRVGIHVHYPFRRW